MNIDEQITYEADEQALQLSTKGEVVSIRLTRSDAPIRVNGKVRLGPSGVHLFNRATGLNVLLDEVQVPASSWAAAPRQVAVALTNACDLACPHCYAPKSPAALNFQRLTGWLKELDAHGCLGVGFGGGEPTLYRRFTELCRYTAQETGLAVTFTTHAHHLTDASAASLAGNVHFVRVSMDGVGHTYEALRGRDFEALRRRFGTISTLAPFGINFVVNARTLPDLDAATELAADVGAGQFLLLPEQPVRGKGGIDDYTMRALQCWVKRCRGTVPLAVSEVGAEDLPTCDPLTSESGLRAYAHVDASGVLKRTSFDSDGVVIGDMGVMEALSVLQSGQEEDMK